MRARIEIANRFSIGWWAPWKVTHPWRPYGWFGTDEWHNPAVSVNIPFLGAYHLWFRNWKDDTDGHHMLSPEMDAPDCPVCLAMLDEENEFPKGWWFNPPRPAKD